MSAVSQRWSATVALVGALLGLAFSWVSTNDYVHHLDRQIHDISCSFIPGVTSAQGADTGCRAAMYSPYAALMRHELWGGVPISLFAVGAFGFFAVFATYLLLAGERAPRRSGHFMALAGWTPLAASVVMAIISAAKLGQFCKTCVGMYAASLLVAIGALGVWIQQRREVRSGLAGARAAKPGTQGEAEGKEEAAPAALPGRPLGHVVLVLAWLAALGLFALTPALVYARSAPRYDEYFGKCGELPVAPKTPKDFPHLAGRRASVPSTVVVDPLCPTCKTLHQRLELEGYLEQLDVTLVPFPLDSACNWMLDRSVHAGSCELSKAVLCGEHRAGEVLQWIYDEQERLTELGKAAAGVNSLHAAIRERWPDLLECVKDKETARRLDRVMRFAVDNRLPVSTPQMFLDGKRVCDEDTDLGLAYALPKMAPALKVK